MFTYFQIIQSLSLLLLLGLGGSSVTGFGEMSTLLQDDNSLLQFLWVYLVFGKILNLLWLKFYKKVMLLGKFDHTTPCLQVRGITMPKH